MTRIILVGFPTAPAGLSASSSIARRQSADLDDDTTVAPPAYKSQHPAVLFDEAHNNLHTAGGLYEPFADLITNGAQIRDEDPTTTTDHGPRTGDNGPDRVRLIARGLRLG